jgi:glucosylceramidase
MSSARLVVVAAFSPALLVLGAAAPSIAAPAAPTAVAAVTSGRAIHVSGAGVSFNATLPASSVATFTWTPGASTVAEYRTTTNGSSLAERGQQQPVIAVSPSSPAGAAAIGVDARQQFQTMTGFGGALTDSAATLIAQSPSRKAIMNALFGATGARMNFVRVPMGATDLSASNYQSYDDSPIPDPGLTKFSIAHDTTNIVPLLQQAKSLQPGIKLLATPWSAPAWMKNGTISTEAAPTMHSTRPTMAATRTTS